MLKLRLRTVLALAFGLFSALAFTHTIHAQTNLPLLGQLDPFTGNNRYADVWGEGNYAYLASFNGNGVMIIDIANPRSPQLVGHYNPTDGGRFQDVIVRNGIGYFSSENRGGVHIVDVRNPASPSLLSQINTDKNGFSNVHELFVADGVLYEADSRTNVIKVFDVRDSRNPAHVRDIVTTDPRFIHAIVVVNGRLFTSGWGGKTDIYDVRDVLTQAPPLLGSLDSGNASHASWPSQDGKLLASARETVNGDIRLFDISNPASPVLLSTIAIENYQLQAYSAHNPYIIGHLLFVSWYQAGLVIFDISDPRQPKLAGNYDTYTGNVLAGFTGCWGVYPFLGFDRVLLSDMDGGLYIVDASTAITGPRTVSAASYNAAALAPNTIAATFGANLASVTQIATTQPLPTTLAGTTLSVVDVKGNERSAPLFFVSPNQINYEMPPGTEPGPALIKIRNAAGQISLGAALVAASAPSLFTLDQSGKGNAVALDALTFAQGPFNATRGQGLPNIIALFGTGLGADATDTDANVAANVRVLLDDQPVTVSYAGRAPGFVGLNQLNIVLPLGIGSGAHKLQVTRDGIASNLVSITIR